MQLTLNTCELPTIDAFAQGQARIGEQTLNSSFIIHPQGLISDELPLAFADIQDSHYAQIQALCTEYDILLLGTGSQLVFPEAERRYALQQHASLDVMDSHAACRTYNILVSEQRRVVAVVFMLT